ncbi:MAG: FAD-dependent oxidoreductase [Nitrospirae bacterium]|nr:FAD-dependent oxidoreductase [Nitrospirota bacterium]MCL5237650.1 FAD-dependent oxidoreductase [Nitrospirota bacterium]
MKHLIIGNGVAGTTAALTIRKFDRESEIVIISDETNPFYSRIRIIDYLAGEVDEKGLVIFKDEWYEKNNIMLLLNTKVTGLEPLSKEVILSGAQRIRYDKLLLATGSTPFTPPLEGAHKNGVFALRTIDDAKKIKDYSKDRNNLIIIGGGALGIEAGEAFRRAGKMVSIVEFLPRLLPRHMDIDGAEILKRNLEERGLRIFLNAGPKEVVGEDTVEGLLLDDGGLIRGDMIITSTGVRSETSLLEGIGVKLGVGVPVNDRMETDVADIYAAGDLAEHRGIFYGIWPAAEKQGEIAGINMAGGNAIYEGTLRSNILKVAGLDLLSAGELNAEGKLESIVVKDADRGIYRKIIIEKDCVAGCILYGDTFGKKEILTAIKERHTMHDMRDALEKLGFSAALK